MENETTQNNSETPVTSAPVEAAVSADVAAAPAAPAAPAMNSRDNRAPREFRKNPRRAPRRESKVKPEFDQKIISIRRVARVVTGGRRFSFSVALVAGDRKGKVGLGLGKAVDTSIAIEKALRDAKKNAIVAHLTKTGSIAHEVHAKYSASQVVIMPAPERGMIAGSSVRTVLELAGVKDVGAKIRTGSKNKINNARAAILALSMVKPPKVRIEKASAAPAAPEAK